jgi:hypothetical protein
MFSVFTDASAACRHLLYVLAELPTLFDFKHVSSICLEKVLA